MNDQKFESHALSDLLLIFLLPVLFGLCCLLALMTGCAPREKTAGELLAVYLQPQNQLRELRKEARDSYAKDYPESPWVEAVSSRQLEVGMPEYEARLVRGSPSRQNETVTVRGTVIQWAYEGFTSTSYLYFVDGVLVRFDK